MSYNIRRQRVHSLKLNVRRTTTTEENIAATKYLRDFYLKDFKYISPQALRSKKLSAKRSLQRTKKAEVVEENLGLTELWYREIMKGLRQFFYGGSLHGVKYIFEPTFSRKEKLTWILIVIISVGFCAANITQLFSKWTSTPFVNVIDSQPTPVWAVPFPTVVLCPQLHVKLSFGNISEMNPMNKFFASLVCPQMAMENIHYGNRLTWQEKQMLQDFIVEASPKCSELIKSCHWRSEGRMRWSSERCCDQLFTPVFTNYGLCFAFNTLPLDGLTESTLEWQKTFNPKVNASPVDWSMDDGYPKVVPLDTTKAPFRVMASGEANGLGVELFLNTSDRQLICEGGSVGYNLLIRSPTDHVYTSTVLRLPMERMTTVEITPVTYKTDPSLRALPPDRRQCFFQNERDLEYYAHYSDSNCKYNLVLRESMQECGCLLYNWPKKSVQDPICTTAEDYQCIEDVKATVDKRLISSYYADTDSDEARRPEYSHAACPPACNDVLYSYQLYYSDMTEETGDVEPEWGQPEMGELMRINVHIYEDIFLGQHRHAQYDDYYFVGAIGGLLSLFLGFSIISVAELVYFLMMRPAHRLFLELYLRHSP